jgi:hypothetical protein
MANLPALPPGRPPKLKELIATLSAPAPATLNAVREAMKAPVSAEWLTGQVLTLRRLYSASQSDDRLEDAMMDAWMDALEPFPQFAVEAACMDYIRSETFPPKPADICQRAAAIMADLRKRLSEASTPREAPPLEISDEERRRRAAVLSNLAAELNAKARAKFGSDKG